MKVLQFLTVLCFLLIFPSFISASLIFPRETFELPEAIQKDVQINNGIATVQCQTGLINHKFLFPSNTTDFSLRIFRDPMFLDSHAFQQIDVTGGLKFTFFWHQDSVLHRPMIDFRTNDVFFYRYFGFTKNGGGKLNEFKAPFFPGSRISSLENGIVYEEFHPSIPSTEYNSTHRTLEIKMTCSPTRDKFYFQFPENFRIGFDGFPPPAKKDSEVSGFHSIGYNEADVIIDETELIPPFYYIGDGVPWLYFYFICGISSIAAAFLVYFFGSTISQMNDLSQTEIEYRGLHRSMNQPKNRLNNLKAVYRQRFQYLGNLRKLYDDFSYKCFRIDYWKNNRNRPKPIPDWAYHTPAARHELKISQQHYRRHLEDVTSGKVPIEEQDAFFFLRRDIQSIEEE